MMKRACFTISILAVVGIASGAAVKIKSLFPENNENGDADGMVILNYNQGNDRTEATVVITDFSELEYRFVVVQTLAGGVRRASGIVGQISTNAAGNGQVHLSVSGDQTISMAPLEILVYVGELPPPPPLPALDPMLPLDVQVRASGVEN